MVSSLRANSAVTAHVLQHRAPADDFVGGRLLLVEGIRDQLMRNWKRNSIALGVVLILLVSVVGWWLLHDQPNHGYVAVFEYALETADPTRFELELKALTDIQVEVFGPGDSISARLEEDESMIINVERDEDLMTCFFNNQTVSIKGLSDDEQLGFPWVNSGDLIYWVEGEDGAALAGIKVSED